MKKKKTYSEKMAAKNAANIKRMKEGREKALHIQKTETPATGLKTLAGKTQTQKLGEQNAEALRKKREVEWGQ